MRIDIPSFEKSTCDLRPDAIGPWRKTAILWREHEHFTRDKHTILRQFALAIAAACRLRDAVEWPNGA